jgi:LmbE family N-acetylglucosaminyl deacetylase
VPDDSGPEDAIRRTTHLGIGAHPDDLEVMALDGILSCFDSEDQWFSGVTVTDGAGSVTEGPYVSCSEEDLVEIRRQEQRKAAVVGEYSIMWQLAHASSSVRDAAFHAHQSEIQRIVHETRPNIVYTHNPADRHSTHVAVSVSVLRALQQLPDDAKPDTVYGCEVWRDLDWLREEDRVEFDVSGMEHLADALIGVFDSQIRGGKRYHQAIEGRQRAHATFNRPHEADEASRLIYAMDLSSVIGPSGPDLSDFLQRHTNNFQTDVLEGLDTFEP